MNLFHSGTDTAPHSSQSPEDHGIAGSELLVDTARADTAGVMQLLGSQPEGLSEAEAAARLKQYGTNEIAREKHQSALMRLLSNRQTPQRDPKLRRHGRAVHRKRGL